MSLDAEHYRAFYDRKTVADFATMFGPATCGCVPQTHSWIRQTLTFALMAKRGPARGWAQCPICKGEGIDPRIVPAWRPDVLVGGSLASCR